MRNMPQAGNYSLMQRIASPLAKTACPHNDNNEKLSTVKASTKKDCRVVATVF